MCFKPIDYQVLIFSGLCYGYCG